MSAGKSSWDEFADMPGTLTNTMSASAKKDSQSWDEFAEMPGTEKTEKPEGFFTARTGLQALKGAPFAIPFVGKALALHQALNPSAQEARDYADEELFNAFHNGFITEAQYEKALKDVASANVEEGAPTLRNLYSAIEKTTGLPLEAKTKAQRGIEFGSEVGALGKGTLAYRAKTGAIAGGLHEKAEDIGIPSWLSDPTLMALALLGNQAGYSAGFRRARPPGTPPPPSGVGTSTSTDIVPTGNAQTVMSSHRVGEMIKAIIPQEEPPSTEMTRREPKPITPSAYTLPPEPPAQNERTIPVPQPIPSKAETGETLPVKKGGPDIGYRPVDYPEPTPQQKALQVITKNEVSSPTAGGFAQKSRILENSRQFRETVEKAYKESRLQAGVVQGPVPDTARKVSEIISALKELDPMKMSAQQKKLLDYATSVQKTLGSPGGGYQEVSAQNLISEVQNINSLIKSEYEHGDPSNIFVPLKNALEKGADSLLAGTKGEQAWLHAKAKNTEWHSIFDNDHVNPFRSMNNKDYESLFHSAENVDAYNDIQKALTTMGGEEGRTLAQIAKRTMVEKILAPYLEEPLKARSQKFRKDLQRLEFQITPQEAKGIDKALTEKRMGWRKVSVKPREEKKTIVSPEREETEKFLSRLKKEELSQRKEHAEKINKRKETHLEERSRKWHVSRETEQKLLGMSEESVARHALTISGLREVGKMLSKYENGEKVFNTIRQWGADRVLTGGKNDATVADMLKVLGDVDKRAYLAEATSSDNVRRLAQRLKTMEKFERLSQKQIDLIDKIKRPKTWANGDTWDKAKEYLYDLARHRRFGSTGMKIIRDFFWSSADAEATIAENQSINEALSKIYEEVEGLSLKD
jgi:hypothetical protein